MLIAITVLILSILMIIIAFIRQSWGDYVFIFAIIINIVPFIFTPYIGMDEGRIVGVPPAYVPFLFAGSYMLLRIGIKIQKKDFGWLVLAMIFIIYISITSFQYGASLTTLSYYLAYIMNIFLFIVAKNYYSKLNFQKIRRILMLLLNVVIIGSTVGIARYLIGVDLDANFMPLLNRNATIVFIISVIPVLMYFYEYKYLSRYRYWLYSLIFLFTLLYIFGRSGIMAFLFVYLAYYFRFRVRSFLIITFSFVILSGIVSLGIADKMLDRFADFNRTLPMLYSGDIEAGVGDYERLLLIRSAVDIAKENFWFGTGVGVENYQREFHKIVVNYDRDSRAHNLYITRFANFGLIGWLLFFTLLIGVYRMLPPWTEGQKYFRISFMGVAILMMFNEYILLPQLWIIFGLYAGMRQKFIDDSWKNKEFKKI